MEYLDDDLKQRLDNRYPDGYSLVLNPKPIFTPKIKEIIQGKRRFEDENWFGALEALIDPTGETLPIRCGERQGQWLCKECHDSIELKKEEILKIDRPGILSLLRLRDHPYLNYCVWLMPVTGYHFKRTRRKGLMDNKLTLEEIIEFL